MLHRLNVQHDQRVLSRWARIRGGPPRQWEIPLPRPGGSGGWLTSLAHWGSSCGVWSLAHPPHQDRCAWCALRTWILRPSPPTGWLPSARRTRGGHSADGRPHPTLWTISGEGAMSGALLGAAVAAMRSVVSPVVAPAADGLAHRRPHRANFAAGTVARRNSPSLETRQAIRPNCNGRRNAMARRVRRLRLLAAGHTAMIAAVVLAIVPLLGNFTDAFPASTFAPPFGHASVRTGFTQEYRAGCVLSIFASPTLNNTTGAGGFAVNSTARACARSLNTSVAYSSTSVVGWASMFVPLDIRHPNSSVRVDWVVDASVNASNYIAGLCPRIVINPTTGDGYQGCSLNVFAELIPFAWIIDRTARIGYASSGCAGAGNGCGDIWVQEGSANDSVCYSFHCSSSGYSYIRAGGFSGVDHSSVWVNGTFNVSHQFDLETGIQCIAYVETWASPQVGSFGGSWASAEIDASPSHGKGWQLSSVRVS